MEKSKYVCTRGHSHFWVPHFSGHHLWSKKVNAKQTDFNIKQRYIWARKCSALSENPPKKHALWSSLIFLFKLLHILGRFLEKLTNFRVFWTLFWLNGLQVSHFEVLTGPWDSFGREMKQNRRFPSFWRSKRGQNWTESDFFVALSFVYIFWFGNFE